MRILANASLHTSPRTTTGRRRGGLSVTELLVIIAIIAILLALLLPALSRVRENARAARCLLNLRTVGMALRYYGDANRDFAVPRYVAGRNDALNWSGPPNYPAWASGYWTSMAYLGQYANNNELHNAVNPNSAFVCPSDYHHTPKNGYTNTSYGIAPGFARIDPPTASNPDPWRKMWRITSVTHPAREMVAVDAFIEWFHPGTSKPETLKFNGHPDPLTDGNYTAEGDPKSYYNWSKRHSNGANVLFIDGHAEWIKDLKQAYDKKELLVDQMFR